MPRFGIPFLVVATLAVCIAINTIQFPAVPDMLSPNSEGASTAPLSQGNSQRDLDSEIPEPIAGLDMSGQTGGSSFPESSTSTEMVAGSPYSAGGSYAGGYANRYDSSPVVAEVARPIASEHAEFSDAPRYESDSATDDDPPPMQSYGSWDTPSFNADRDEEASTQPHETDDSRSYDSQSEPSYDYGTRSGYDTGDRYSEYKEDENTYIPPPSEPAAKTEIDWPAEAATTARYARRSTTSTIVHGSPPQAADTGSTPESSPSTAIASSKRLVPVHRPYASAERPQAQSVGVSDERTIRPEETSALPETERLPAVE